jgi:hypothetical protein
MICFNYKYLSKSKESVKMASNQYNPLEFRECEGGKYYSYDDELYTETFPREWARNHLPGTGPKECMNCRDFGSWNGVFVSYCVNCATMDYQGLRGGGVYKIADGEEPGIIQIKDTYMEGVDMNDIGNKEYFVDSGKVYGVSMYNVTFADMTEYNRYHGSLTEEEIDGLQSQPVVETETETVVETTTVPDCPGCQTNQPNQQAHMDTSGCLYFADDFVDSLTHEELEHEGDLDYIDYIDQQYAYTPCDDDDYDVKRYNLDTGNHFDE